MGRQNAAQRKRDPNRRSMGYYSLFRLSLCASLSVNFQIPFERRPRRSRRDCAPIGRQTSLQIPTFPASRFAEHLPLWRAAAASRARRAPCPSTIVLVPSREWKRGKCNRFEILTNLSPPLVRRRRRRRELSVQRAASTRVDAPAARELPPARRSCGLAARQMIGSLRKMVIVSCLACVIGSAGSTIVPRSR